MNEINIKDLRKCIGRIIILVLTDKINVKDALLHFPKDLFDPSIKSAYHALAHREADEDLRHQDLLYKEEQDSYLEFIANTLQRGEELPKNIVKNYRKYYSEQYFNYSELLRKILRKVATFLNI